MARARECAFCQDAANLTGEHLWSAWTSNLFPTHEFQFVRRENDGVSKVWRDDGFNSKARVVCGKCNSGWMSEIESRTKPIIGNMIARCSETILDSRDLSTIASLLLIKAIVADQMHDKRPPVFTLGERRSFSEALVIPTGVQMWLGSTIQTLGLFKSHHVETTGNTSRDFRLQAFTYGVGHFVAQLTVFRWKKRLFRSQVKELFLEQNPVWDSVSIPFWPITGVRVDWPPLKGMSNEIADAYVKRWARLERPARSGKV